MYRNTLLIEMQLGVKTGKSNFIKHSNHFSHFIYELKRSKFGAVTELCSIWAGKDPRGKIYRSYLEENNIFKWGNQSEEEKKGDC